MDVPQNRNIDIALFFKFPRKSSGKPLAIFQSATRKLTEFHTVFPFVTDQHFLLIIDQNTIYPYVKMTVHHRASRSEEHTSELQSLMRISYAVFCLKKKKKTTNK